MDTKPVVDTLAAIPIGTYITWALVIIGIIAAIAAGISFIIKNYEKYRSIKEEDKRQKEAIDKHEKALEDIKASLDRIEKNFQEDHEAQKRRLKYTIINACNSALKDGVIKLSTLRSIEETFDDYLHIYNGNSYVHTLVERIRALPTDVDIEEE